MSYEPRGVDPDTILNAVKLDSFTVDGGVLVGTGASTKAEETGDTLRTSLGLAIGTDVQAYDANLRAPWLTIAAANYTATPTDTDTLAMSDTTGMAVGLPIRYTIGGATYRGQITAVVTDTSIDVSGAPISGDVTKLEIGD